MVQSRSDLRMSAKQSQTDGHHLTVKRSQRFHLMSRIPSRPHSGNMGRCLCAGRLLLHAPAWLSQPDTAYAKCARCQRELPCPT
jgi:hypothetical protein